MGQHESKQRLEQITQSLNRIRKDARTGKITANDVERIQGVLRNYTAEIEGSRNVKASSVYTIEQLIEITSKELDALKQEVNLDLAAVPTNSFRRSSSKNMSKDKRKSIKSVTDAVQDIRQQIRSGKLQPADYDRVQSDLANYSQLLSKKNRKHDADIAQKLISSVTQELFNKQQENSDSGSLKRASLKRGDRVSLEEKRSSWVEKRSSVDMEKPKEAPQIANKNTRSTLDDIENKLEALKNDIKVAENNKDKSRLHFLSKSIQTLMIDLQMVNANKQILQEQRKTLLEKNLQRAYQQIDKIKRQLVEENDLKYLTNLHKKEKKEKSLQDLEEIQKGLVGISQNLSVKNFQAEKDNFNLLKDKLNSIEGEDENISSKKLEISGIVSDVENAFTRTEMEERVNQAEWRHFQYKIDLEQFKEISNSDIYKRHRQYLVQLRDYVNKVLDVNNKVEEKKKYVLYNIDNNVIALDQKVKENDDKLKKPEGETTTKNKSSRDLVKNVWTAAKELPQNYTSQEVKEIIPLLIEVKSIVDQKLTVLQNQSKPQVDGIQVVTVREKHLQPMDNPNRLQDDDTQLVTVREKQLQPIANSVLPLQTHFGNIQKEVETLQVSIENSRYNKDTQFYNDVKSQLEEYRNQVEQRNADKSSDNLLNYIDNVLLLLDSNISSRKSTTEDILIDIMSVSTRVNDLGNKIQNFGQTVQDYNSIKSSLVENRNYLRNLQIPSNRANISKSRDDVLQQIERHLKTLDDIKKNENNTGSEEQKRFNQDLRKLKEKVFRYSGTYKNVLYKTIENDLDRYLHKADSVFNDGNVALKVKQDIENTKMILEQKSTKDQNFVNIKQESGSKRLAEIRQNVINVEKTLSQNELLTNEDLEKLDARLTLSILALDNIREGQSNEEKDRLYQDIRVFFRKIQELKLMTTPNSVQVEDHHHKHLDEKQVMEATISRIERELEEIKPEILTFVGTETSSTFLLLDEILVRGTLKLDEMTLEPTSDLFSRKAKLMRDIHQYSDVLDARINQTEAIEKFEHQVKVVLIKIDSFNGFLGDSEYTQLDEEIIRLKVNLGKLQVSEELTPRKAACLREIDTCMKKLNEAAKSSPDVLAGTLV